jgi:hypothetical protein
MGRGFFLLFGAHASWHGDCCAGITMPIPTLSPHTVRSRVLSRALLDRDLDPLPFDLRISDPGERGGALRTMYVAAIGGDFDDDDPRWRRGRRAKRTRFRA